MPNMRRIILVAPEGATIADALGYTDVLTKLVRDPSVIIKPRWHHTKGILVKGFDLVHVHCVVEIARGEGILWAEQAEDVLGTKQVMMTVGGLICPEDADTLEQALQQVAGIVYFDIDDRGNATLTVTDTLEDETIRSAIEQLGFTVNIEQKEK